MIVGIGTDLVQTKRVHEACSKESFVKRCFTNSEKIIIDRRKDSAAGNFAAKEAVSKVLGTGFRDFWLTDIEILRDELGKPYVNLYNNALKRAKELGIDVIHVSIADTKEMAIAYAIGEKTDGVCSDSQRGKIY